MISIDKQELSKEAKEEKQFFQEQRRLTEKIWKLKAQDKACKKCFDEGYAIDWANNYNLTEVAWVCECGALQRIKAEEHRDQVRDRAMDTFQEIKPHHNTMLQVAKKFLNQENQKWIYVGGAVGSGKTHLCEVLVKELFEKTKLTTRTEKWRDLAKRIKSDPTSEVLMLELKAVPILYIDDLFKSGGDKVTEADVNIAYDIIEGRMNFGGYTIINSEYTIQSLKEIDKSVTSRIVEKAGDFIINISEGEGKDVRYQ
jgi:DNA replication protein DnaC